MNDSNLTKEGNVVKRKSLLNNKNAVKQFCPKGHDKDIVGRYNNGNCIPCNQQSSKINDLKKDPIKTKESRLISRY